MRRPALPLRRRGDSRGSGVPGAARLQGQRLQQHPIAPAVQEGLRGTTDSPRILLIHVPKTGGSSLRGMLAAHVPEEETFLSTRQEWTRSSLEDLRGIRLFAGHNYLEPLYLFPDDAWVTVLTWRDPLGWWQSMWKFRRRQLRESGDHDHRLLHETFDDYVQRRPPRHLSNPQTSWLLARARVMFDSVHAGPDLAGSVPGMLKRDGLRAADLLERVVERVTVAGTIDQLLEVYRSTCVASGFDAAHQEPLRENVTTEPDELLALSPSSLDKLMSLNQLDAHGLDLITRRPVLRPGR